MRIGVFDSGIGGMTVLREIRRLLPGHSTAYLGDTARVPYGAKSPETIRRYAGACADFLLHEGVDFLVVACNTASAHGLERLASLPIPVVGVIEPGAELAARRADGLIGVLGTAGTVRSGAYERAIRARAPEARISAIACPLFVPLVEEGWEESEIALATARKYLAPWLGDPAARPAAVILGCTHYPLLRPIIQRVLGGQTLLIDSAETVAIHVKERLAGKPEDAAPSHRLFLTDASDSFMQFARRMTSDLGGAADARIELADLELAPVRP